MRVNRDVTCPSFSCTDVVHACHSIPSVELDPSSVSILLISEAAPPDPTDGYYAQGRPMFEATTVAAFRDAGADVASIADILELGCYMTPALKCAKQGYGVSAATVRNCSGLLEQEMRQFPSVKAYLLMGDVAIKAFNAIAKRQGQGRIIPAGSTYRLRDAHYVFGEARVFPSYLQAGPSYFIEKSKRRMIAEDIAAALDIANG